MDKRRPSISFATVWMNHPKWLLFTGEHYMDSIQRIFTVAAMKRLIHLHWLKLQTPEPLEGIPPWSGLLLKALTETRLSDLSWFLWIIWRRWSWWCLNVPFSAIKVMGPASEGYYLGKERLTYVSTVIATAPMQTFQSFQGATITL